MNATMIALNAEIAKIAKPTAEQNCAITEARWLARAGKPLADCLRRLAIG